MPAISIKDYTWRQTSNFVILNIPLRGHPKNVDIFVMDNYAKVSFPPFVLELFLWADVLEKESKCVVTDQEAILSLQKVNIGREWQTLEIQNIDNEIKREYRNQALERAQAVAAESVKIKDEKRTHLRKQAVDQQISINTATLNKIDAIRNSHRKEAMREFDSWRSKAELPFLLDAEGTVQENRKAYNPPLKWAKDENNTLKSRPMTEDEIFGVDEFKKEIRSIESKNSACNISEVTESLGETERNEEIDDKKAAEIQSGSENANSNMVISKTEVGECTSDTSEDSSSSEDSESESGLEKSRSFVKGMDKEELKKSYEKTRKARPGLATVKAIIKGKLMKRNSIFEEPSRSIPLPRQRGTIDVTFSERKFPTPARESSHLNEQEWLEKQVEAKRKIGFDTDDLRQEERDPQWLKDKGDEFYKVGNYLAAISAYSYGIKISDKMTSLYVNRSAAQYALGNYQRCIEDCSMALELMEPKCEGNRESRARCHARRGAALCKISAPQHGIPELEVALELAPDNESIKRDVLAAKQYFDIND